MDDPIGFVARILTRQRDFFLRGMELWSAEMMLFS